MTVVLFTIALYGAWSILDPDQEPPFNVAGQTQLSPHTSELERENWKVYRNQQLGFEFRYPSTWTDIGQATFIAPPRIKVLEIEEIDLVNHSPSLQDTALMEIEQNNCRDRDGNSYDHIIRITDNGVLYVLHCSAFSETYHYLFKNSNRDVVRINYHDDFDYDWSEQTKLRTLNAILSTLTLIDVERQN